MNGHYDFVRHASFAERAATKNALRASVAEKFPELATLPELRSNQFGESQLKEFLENGIITFGQYIDAEERADILRYLADHPVYNAHIAACSDGVPRRIGDPNDPAEAYQFGSYAEDVIARMPHVTKIALNPAVLNFVKRYFGVMPLLLDVHLWWSFPRPGQLGPQPFAGQGFHRDFRSLQDIQFFTSLNDMPDNDGAHEYFAGTHNEGVFAKQLHRYEALRKLPEEEALRLVFFPPGDGYGERPGDVDNDVKWTEVLAGSMIRVPMRAGHSFMIDTMGLHRGVPPRIARRLVFSARYSTSGVESMLKQQTPVEVSTKARPSERAYTLFAFQAKLGDVLGPEWSSDKPIIVKERPASKEQPVATTKAPAKSEEQTAVAAGASLEDFKQSIEARLLAMEAALADRSQRIRSLEMNLQERSSRLAALERMLEERTVRLRTLEMTSRPLWRRAGSLVKQRLSAIRGKASG